MELRKKFIAIIITIVFYITLLIPPLSGNRYDTEREKDLNYIQGYKIDFNSPSIILDCFSFFYVNVTVERVRVTTPSVLIIFVFLYLPYESFENRLSLIGISTPTYFPATEAKLNISVPCITWNRVSERLSCLKSGEKEKFNLKKGYIYVSLKKAKNIGILAHFASWWWKKIYERRWEEDIWMLLTTNLCPIRILNQLILFKIGSDLLSLKTIMNPFNVAHEVNVSSPFIYSDKIKFTLLNYPESTNEKGEFAINISIENHLEWDIVAGVVVDVSEESFTNVLFPRLIATVNRYNVAFKDYNLHAGENVTDMIKCSFPPGGFERKKYTVRVECGPYIQIGDSNKFGIYFYDIRWVGYIKPHYYVNQSVQEKIKEFWYNLPIFSLGDTSDFLPVQTFEIKYEGKEAFTIEKAVEKAVNLLALMFILIFLLIIIALVGYRAIVKK